ncbi:DUF5753 domain-containing protein [Streptomycetaceae bacterium NBC_01309]
MPTSSSVQQARRALGARLRELREDRRLNLTKHAALCGWSRSKSSRIEDGLTQPSPDDIELWCAVCAAAPEAPNLIASLRALTGMFTEWRRMERTGLKRAQEAVLPLFERTRRFRSYASWMVPGLIQSRAYTTAVLRATQQRRVTIDDVEAAVDVRMDRQRILYGGKATFAFLIEECVLRNCIGDAEVLAGQLGTLITVSALPNVSVGVIPAQAERVRMPAEEFWIFDAAQVNVELVSGYLTLSQPYEISAYEQAFEQMWSMAVHGPTARELITVALSSLG